MADVHDLKVVDALGLPDDVRAVLRPGALVRDAEGRARRLPRFFYEVPSWEAALETWLAPHFRLSEFVHTDVREAPPLRGFPRYVPCAVLLLAAHLELLRRHAGTFVRVAANGGYRSPGHERAERDGAASLHLWGTAADVVRIGDDVLDAAETIERYRAVVHELMPGVWTRPPEADRLDDHLHLDLGHAVVVPHEAPDEDDEPA